METVIVHPQTEDKLQALKTFLEEQHIEFEESSYDPEFVAKIRQGERDLKDGKGVIISLEDLWK